MFRHKKRTRPGFTTVSAFVNTAFAAATPKWAVGCYPNDVFVCRMHDDFTDVLRIFETHIRKRLSAIDWFVHAIAVRNRTLVVVLARTHPNCTWITRCKRHTTNGVRTVTIKNWFEGNAVVLGIPNSTCSSSHIPSIFIGWVYCEVYHTPWSQGRTYHSKRQSANGSGVIRWFFYRCGCFLLCISNTCQ